MTSIEVFLTVSLLSLNSKETRTKKKKKIADLRGLWLLRKFSGQYNMECKQSSVEDMHTELGWLRANEEIWLNSEQKIKIILIYKTSVLMLILTVLQWTGTERKSINFILVWLQFNFYVFELNIVSNLSWKLG